MRKARKRARQIDPLILCEDDRGYRFGVQGEID